MLRERLNRAAYFGLHHLIGSDLAKHYREFIDLEKQSYEWLRGLQNQRLGKLLSYAASEIPFYRKHVTQRAEYVLSDFPVLTKRDIRDNFEDLMSPQIRQEHLSAKQNWSYSWILVQTGGSIGTPTTVIHDKSFRDMNRAARLYTQYLCGFAFGTPYFKLWGSMREINHAQESLQHRIASTLAGEIVLNAFRMEDSQIDSYVQAVNHSSIDHLMAYSDAAYRMAERTRTAKLKIRSLKSVMACAGTLTDGMRQSITNAFGQARVHNMYGSRDCGAMACECLRGGFHILENKVILETVDQAGAPARPGEAGRILVTLLGNYGFPMIRYEIGDVGSISRTRCDCGIPTAVLDRVEGRTVEFLLSANGGYISPAYIFHLIGVVHNSGVIRRFQIVQDAMDHAVLALEKESGTAEAAVDDSIANIRRDLITVFGAGMNLEIKVVDRIPESNSGKFIPCINRIGWSARL